MPSNPQAILEKYWGYDRFRPLQLDIINSVIQKKDCIALMPTGGGKSLCFQIPALCFEGLCIVVTPLIALMKDQVENLKKRGISAEAIFSGMHAREIEKILNNAVYNQYKLLYISPERLETSSFRSAAPHIPISFLAVDEAHCISEWGYDFRPSYLKIPSVKEFFPEISILALTASATPDVIDDIADKLELKTPLIYKLSFDRSNLIYGVIHCEEKKDKMLDLLQKVPGTAIIYSRSRKKTKEISDFLQKKGISSAFYHGGLENQERSRKQDEWMNNKVRVMSATNAFGMGIDKPDVRLIIHMDLPDSLEAYYQEAGRAGRDLKKSFAVALVNANDLTDLEKRSENSFPSADEIKIVYEALGNHFQIPVGSGLGMEFPFDFSEFCSKYNFNSINAYSCLKILEQLGYITSSENFNLPSKINIIPSYSELYRFQLGHKEFEPIIITLLRSYEGLFDNYVRINEQELAKRTGISMEMLIRQLNQLKKMEVIDYLPAVNKPFITYMTERLNKGNLLLSWQAIQKRKLHFEKKIQAMRRYAFEISDCKSRFLLKYFGENAQNRCGHCDYCLKLDKTHLTEAEFSTYAGKITEELKSQSITLHQVMDICRDIPKEKTAVIVQWMIDYGRIILSKDGKISLNN